MSDIFDPLEPSPYKVLNVANDATTQQIRTAHRKLVLVFHPDKVQNESEKAAKTERFQEIQHAYEILQDEKRRARWDKRAADRDRQMEERRTPRKASAYTPSRPSQGPVFENRDGVILEERVPRYARHYEENTFDAAFASGTTRSSKKWDDTYVESSSRKTSGKGPEPRSRYKDMDSELSAKMQEKRKKDEKKAAYEESQKRRDKTRRHDAEASFSRRTRVDEYADSDYDEHHHSSKSDSKSKRKPAESRRSRDEEQRRSNKKDARSGDSDLDQKIYSVHSYIGKSRETESDNRHSGRARADSYTPRTQQPTPPLTPRDRDSGRRSSGDDGRKSSVRARRPSPARRNTYKDIDIVDPPSSSKSRTYEDRPRDKAMPPRSRTQVQESDLPKPGLRRAETMPMHHMSAAADHRTAPKYRPQMRGFDVSEESSDSSDSSTDSDSEIERRKTKPPPAVKRPSLQSTTTRTSSYKVNPHTVTAEPESYDNDREPSPRSHPRRSTTNDRYGSATAHRSPLAHSATFTERPSPRHAESSSSRTMPSLRTSQSARGDSQPWLFGAIDNELPSSPRTTSSPKGFPEARFRSGRDSAGHSRRGSEDLPADYSPRSGGRRMDSRRGYSREIPAAR